MEQQREEARKAKERKVKDIMSVVHFPLCLSSVSLIFSPLGPFSLVIFFLFSFPLFSFLLVCPQDLNEAQI